MALKLARAAYGLLFCAVLPTLLVLWARATAGLVHLPVYGSVELGAVIVAIGMVVLAAGMAALRFRGGGLPMNAFPPPRLVTSGAYALFPHPIYTGFTLLCFGVSMAARSASGLWLVSPVSALGCAALVYGYENADLVRRFGGESLKAIRILPPATAARPDFLDALRFCLFVQIPWLALYEIVATIGIAPHSLDTRLPFEARLPVWTWTEPIYASTYLIALLAPLITPTRRGLRALTVRSWLAMATIFPVYLCLPTHAPFRPFEAGGPLAAMLRLERALDMPGEALPSFHVVWAVLASCVLGRAGAVWAALVAASCVMNGMHSIADVAAGWVAGLLLIRADRIWQATRGTAERIANSWREWRAGSRRFINHGLYAGLATFVCLGIISTLAGPRHQWAVAATALGALAGAGLWAQWVEGSPRLLRPFGFYGGLVGVIAVACFSRDNWTILGAYCVAAPWLQGIGRLRCLVQGCCHGSPADPAIGIRYCDPHSRVTRVPGLAGVPLHPTPLYSIFGNAISALALARLWSVGAPLHLIAGVYLILSGLARFVEEAYRGEPQTPTIAGLRLYQWIAIVSVMAGATITAIANSSPAPAPQFTGTGIALASFFALLSALALGADAPESKRRFGRLT